MPDPTTDADSMIVDADSEPQYAAVPLLAPREGVPEVVNTASALREAAAALAEGTGPLAVDAERASGFRYSARAYLVQLRRQGAGTVLLDPIPLTGQLEPLADVINPLEWVLHSADQDLPGLAELGLAPATLFDSELAGRLAGFERVGLAAIIERTLGFELRKGHGAADWSKRPLPPAWLNYAALDVELLVDLREAMAAELRSQNKLEWAHEEFEYIRCAGPPKRKPQRWRRTSHITSLKSPRQLAAARALWETREAIAEKRDITPTRVLPDSAIIDAASKDPRSVDALRALPVFGGPRQRRYSRIWLGALDEARALDESQLPPRTPTITGPPQPGKWARVNPEAADRLTAARGALGELSESVAVPVENLVSPELVRRLCWDWDPTVDDASGVVERVLRDGGARPWQRQVAGSALASTLSDLHVTHG